MLVLEAALMGVFLGLDLILFFVFFEFVLVPMYFIILGLGSRSPSVRGAEVLPLHDGGLGVPARRPARRSRSSTRTRPATSRSISATLTAWAPGGLDSGTAKWLFMAFFAAFAVKVPLFPLHTWLPDAHTEAPTAGSVILAGVLLKMGDVRLPALLARAVPAGRRRPRARCCSCWRTIGIIYGAIVADDATEPETR